MNCFKVLQFYFQSVYVYEEHPKSNKTLKYIGLLTMSSSWRGTPHFPELPNWNLTIRYSFVSYTGHSLWKGPYPSAEKQLVYSSALLLNRPFSLYLTINFLLISLFVFIKFLPLWLASDSSRPWPWLRFSLSASYFCPYAKLSKA